MLAHSASHVYLESVSRPPLSPVYWFVGNLHCTIYFTDLHDERVGAKTKLGRTPLAQEWRAEVSLGGGEESGAPERSAKESEGSRGGGASALLSQQQGLQHGGAVKSNSSTRCTNLWSIRACARRPLIF